MIRTMKVGDVRSYQKVIKSEDVHQFGHLTGDLNQTHFDEAYAATTIFKKPIVHGMLVGSLFSKIFGLDYPGEGTIYCSQSLKFLKPVYPDTQLTIKVTVQEINLDKNRVYFLTEVYNEQNECAVTGEAMLMPKKVK